MTFSSQSTTSASTSSNVSTTTSLSILTTTSTIIETYENPVWEPVLADPSIVKDADGFYYVFGTQDYGQWGESFGTPIRPNLTIGESRRLAICRKFVHNAVRAPFGGRQSRSLGSRRG
ncbi:MAG: hypothetical protein MZU97_23135 [Bacillus subtilis]|nr:hypothetical protein [Bacillus subtilis]